MSTFDSGPVKLDATAITLRSFNIRLSSAERMIEIAQRIAAQAPREGKEGAQGPRGPQGPEGPPGPPPAHRWEGTKLQFEQTTGEWGEAVDLKGPKGDAGAAGGVAVVQTNNYMPGGW